MSLDGDAPFKASEFPAGGGEAGALIRALDWSATPVGPTETWPPSLRTIVETLVSSRHPMFLWWGPELIQFYNDAYTPSFPGKHPRAMGQRGAECWQEIWPIIGPQIEGVMTRGEPTWDEDAHVPIFRNGRIEEVYWTYGYSPVFTDGRRVGGTLVVCTETTSRVIASRRQRLFRKLAEQTSSLDHRDGVIAAAVATLGTLPEDIPFAAAFSDRRVGAPQHSVRLDGDAADVVARLAPRLVGITEPARLALDTPVAAGPWPEPVRDVLAVPMPGRGHIVFGLSSRLPFDDAYRTFLVHVVDAMRAALERSEAQAIRATVEAERRDLLLQAPVATALMTGPDHLFELANPLYVRMVGREVLGKTYVEAFPELAGSELVRILDEAYTTGTPYVTNELAVDLDRERTGTSQRAYFKFNLQPIRDEVGAVYGMMAIAVDITEIVEAREAQARAHAELQRSHDERTALVAELEHASRAKDEFLAMLGHELRNPLAPIVTALDLMQMREGQDTRRERSIIENQLKHVIRLVDDLLDVSKITRGKLELERALVDIADVVREAVAIASSLIDARRHRLTVDVPRGELHCWGDPVRLAQVIANLLTNAARYTNPGGDIRVRATRDGDDIVISVHDTGIGITPELLPRVFELFVQGRRGSDRAEGGLGLGLALVKNLVTLHAGTVEARSAGRDRGSEFVVRLPGASNAAAAHEATPTERSAAPAPERKRVLVVDDNVDAAMMMTELLRAKGHDVRVVHDAIAALAVFEQFRPEVAFFDIGLPAIDGYELASRLASAGLTRDCRLVAVTGYGQDRDRRRAIDAGFHAHLVKPVTLAALLGVVEAR